jgi:peptide chain release factor subunit 1
MSSVRDETAILTDFYERISRGRRDIVFGLQHTMRAYMEGLVKTLIIDQNSDAGVIRINQSTATGTLWNPNDDTVDSVRFITGDSSTSCDMKLLDWLFERMGGVSSSVELRFVSETSAQGTQFIRGFGGIGGFMAYEVDMDSIIGEDISLVAPTISDSKSNNTIITHSETGVRRYEEEELFI